MPPSPEWPLSISILLFLISAIVVGGFGYWSTALADQLADRTGLGEALSGALFLGAATSLPEIVTSGTAAAENHPELAVSNALGGIAAQTSFLALADILYRRANLEHAAASTGNIMQGTLAILLLTIPLLAFVTPDMTILGIHPATPLMLIAYVYGLSLVYEAQTVPMWRPRQTRETREDRPQVWPPGPSVAGLWSRFAFGIVIVGGSGWVLAQAGISISDKTGLSETVVGAYFTAVATSAPELVIAVSAVRRDALTLAVGSIMGGNAFDTLLLAFSDLLYRKGSIFHALTDRQTFLLALTILMTSILVMGLVRREERGIANIGLESVLLLVVYVSGVGYLVWQEP